MYGRITLILPEGISAAVHTYSLVITLYPHIKSVLCTHSLVAILGSKLTNLSARLVVILIQLITRSSAAGC